MLNLISGIIMLCGVLGLALRYHPKKRESRLLCGIGLFMGGLSLLMSDGLLPFQAVEQGMQLLVLGMCWYQLRREERQRKARAALRHRRKAACGVPAVQPKVQGTFRHCA